MKDLLITSAYAVPLNGETPAEIMYMPAGRSTIRANVNGKPKQITVNVTKDTVDTLQASLAKLFTEPVQPFIDFNHKEDESAAVPTGFSWSDEGIMLALDWTSAGKSAVEGKTYRYFSPTFLLSEAGEPTSLPDSGPVGALTNNPAFRRMKRITAAEAALTEESTQMAEQANDTVTAALRSELETVKAENKALRESIETQRVEAINREADLAIEGAIAQGKIAPKNEVVKASLKKWFVSDPAGAKAHIDSLPTNPAFKTVIQATAATRETGKPPGTNHAGECKALVLEVQAANKGMSFEDAWSIAEARHPDKFPQSRVNA
jgi:phage I-like protein